MPLVLLTPFAELFQPVFPRGRRPLTRCSVLCSGRQEAWPLGSSCGLCGLWLYHLSLGEKKPRRCASERCSRYSLGEVKLLLIRAAATQFKGQIRPVSLGLIQQADTLCCLRQRISMEDPFSEPAHRSRRKLRALSAVGGGAAQGCLLASGPAAAWTV